MNALNAEQPVASDNTPYVQTRPLESSRKNLISPNWCNKTTWYDSSQRVTGATMVDSGDHQTYNLSSPYATVDVAHGRLSHENTLTAYRTVVKVDGVEKTENSPDTTDGDYDVDYDTGSVTFNTALAGTETVTSDHSKVIDSKWDVVPTQGKVLRITGVEVQMSTNCVMQDTLNFQVYAEVGKHPLFDPYLQRSGVITQIADAGGGKVRVTSASHGLSEGYTVGIVSTTSYNGQYQISNVTNKTFDITHTWEGNETGGWGSGVYASGTVLPFGSPVQYQTIMDLINESNGSYTIIPACGGTGWRGLPYDIMLFRWDYKATLDLRSDWGMYLELGMLNDNEHGGWAAISTLYCLSRDL